LKVKELPTPLLCEVDALRYFLESLLNEAFELVFVLNDDQCYRPFEILSDLLNWIQAW
jgi:hypothetical protein